MGYYIASMKIPTVANVAIFIFSKLELLFFNATKLEFNVTMFSSFHPINWVT